MSLEKRIENLEEHFGPTTEQELQERRRRNQRFLDETTRDFEALVPKVVPRVDAGLVSRAYLENESPRTIAAVYAVLRSRSDPRAEDVKATHEAVMEQRRQHPSYVELEEMFPGTHRKFQDWFWEVVERYAESHENRL
jgi:hypothetical protein